MTEQTSATSPPPPLPEPERPNRDGALRAADFALLARPFAAAVAFLFPEGLEPDFAGEAAAEPAPDGDLHLILAPLDLPDGGRVTLRLATGDEALAAAVTDDWLALQADNALRVLERLRPAYIDAETGFYNLRALAAVPAETRGVFFLLHAAGGRRNPGDAIRCAATTAALLPQYLDGALFALGHGLFAALLPQADDSVPPQAVKGARLLQRRLRQEGLTQARMLCMAAPAARRLFARGGLAAFQEGLEAAGRQGPFGLTCGDDADRVPAALRPADDALEQALRGRRAPGVFSLALFRLEAPENAVFDDDDFADFSSVPGNAPILTDPKNLALILPGLRPEEAAAPAEAARARLLARRPDAAIAVGIAGHPCLDYARKDAPANARKALLHAALLAKDQGPGQLVVFDHLTLNVSGDACYEAGDLRGALREYRRGLKLKPDDVNLLNSLGATLAALGEEGRAAGRFREALAREPDNHMALANLGALLLRGGKRDEALACLQRALAAFPEDGPEAPPAELLRPLVQLLLDKSRFAEARDALARWERARPTEDDALYQRLLGMALQGAGRIEPALRAMERAVKLNPRDALALGRLGELYRLSGEGAELGLRFCRRAVGLRPDDAGLRRILGECLLARGGPEDLDEAEDAARRALRRRADDGEALWLLARVLLQKKNAAEARKLLNRAMKLHTIGGDLKKRLARALETAAKRGGESGRRRAESFPQKTKSQKTQAATRNPSRNNR